MTDSLFSADASSEKINSIGDARYILKQLDGHHPQLNVWIDWAEVTLSGQPW